MKKVCSIILILGLFIPSSVPLITASNNDNVCSHPHWMQLGPPGGTINAIIPDPTNENIFYAGTNTGIFKSLDAGYHWFEIGTQYLPAHADVLSLAIDPYHSNIIYCGLSGYMGPVMYKSNDYGQSWKVGISDLPYGQAVPAIAVDPVYDGYVYAGTTRGVYRSTDYGHTWNFFGLDWKAIYSLSFNIRPDQTHTTPSPPDYTLYACVDWPTGEIYRYHDQEWARCSTEFIHPEYFHPKQVVAAGNLVIVGGSGWLGGDDADLYISQDEGNHWTPIYPVIWGSSQQSRFQQKTDQGLRNLNIRDLNKDLDLLPPPEGVVDLIITSIIYEPFRASEWGGPGLITVGVMNGMLCARTNDLTHWNDISGDLHGFFISCLAKTKNTFLVGTGYYLYEGFGDGGIFRSNCSLSSPSAPYLWQSVHGPSSSSVLSLIATPSTIVAGKDSGIYRSITKGRTWDRSSYQNYCEDYDILGLQTSGISTLTVDPNNEAVIYGGSQTGFVDVFGILKSEDGGLNWETLLLYGGNTNVIKVDPYNSQHIIAGYSSFTGGILNSFDGGSTWEIYPLDTPIYTLAFDPVNEDIVYAGGVGFYVSYDNGLTWDLQALPGVSIVSLTIDPDPHVIYIGTTDNGIYKSNNQGSTWTQINNGLPSNLYVSSLQLINTNLYAGVYNGGVYVLKTQGSIPQWNRVSLGLTNLRVTALAYSDALYAATYGSGVFRLDI